MFDARGRGSEPARDLAQGCVVQVIWDSDTRALSFGVNVSCARAVYGRANPQLDGVWDMVHHGFISGPREHKLRSAPCTRVVSDVSCRVSSPGCRPLFVYAAFCCLCCLCCFCLCCLCNKLARHWFPLFMLRLFRLFRQLARSTLVYP